MRYWNRVLAEMGGGAEAVAHREAIIRRYGVQYVSNAALAYCAIHFGLEGDSPRSTEEAEKGLRVAVTMLDWASGLPAG